MHLYRSLSSYNGEYLKKGKYFYWPPRKTTHNVFAVYLQVVLLQGCSTTPHLTASVYSKQRSFTLSKYIRLCVDQYCECNKNFSVLSTQNLYRVSSNSTTYMFRPSVLNGQFSIVLQSMLDSISEFLFLPCKLCVFVNGIISPVQVYLLNAMSF